MSTRVLVTGATSGLGRAIAGHYAAAGCRVLVTDLAPDPAGAGPLPAGEVSYHRLDVRSEPEWHAARAWCEEHWGGLDILVNNAGVAAAGRIERVEEADWQWILDINLLGAVRGCRTFVPVLKRQGSGHIVNIASLAGLMNMPGVASYNVSKAAVISLSETLRYELAPWGVHTTVVCPGFVPTALDTALRSPDPVLAEQATGLIRRGTRTPEQIAEQVADAVARRRFLVNTHPEGRRALRIRRLWPALVDRKIAEAWQRTKERLDAQDAQQPPHPQEPTA
ncbi:SDR family NAD(P)-dependent oxidoreductase [Streptomyces sp. TRM 70361]|uniref:SDR family NAD(P)-dependent oxidoreductase n=1 Tax=Streptomyces sp. TRM 70361 TaxID=3116553 RepID=UPI002E7BBAC5|nr:SDR family NAD(P)-dependent oxidoreductase [Streptomyces sp. TRM 70361]MEE1943179.1 SDR family NAD(P)-dependent oxidoreductase [Streptomyces sp. TRM 70361]